MRSAVLIYEYFLLKHLNKVKKGGKYTERGGRSICSYGLKEWRSDVEIRIGNDYGVSGLDSNQAVVSIICSKAYGI